MDKDREMGMAVMAAMVLWVVICLLAMCSCGSKKVVTENVVTHDTIVVTHSDTISVDRWLTHYDTLRIESERVVTLLQQEKDVPAETIRIETNNWHWQHIADSDTETMFVSKVDSILRAMDASHNKVAEKTKERMPWWGWLTIGGGLAMGCVGILASRKS